MSTVTPLQVWSGVGHPLANVVVFPTPSAIVPATCVAFNGCVPSVFRDPSTSTLLNVASPAGVDHPDLAMERTSFASTVSVRPPEDVTASLKFSVASNVDPIAYSSSAKSSNANASGRTVSTVTPLQVWSGGQPLANVVVFPATSRIAPATWVAFNGCVPSVLRDPSGRSSLKVTSSDATVQLTSGRSCEAVPSTVSVRPPEEVTASLKCSVASSFGPGPLGAPIPYASCAKSSNGSVARSSGATRSQVTVTHSSSYLNLSSEIVIVSFSSS